MSEDEKWIKGIGWWFDGKGLRFMCPPFDHPTGFTMADLKATDWELCPKE